MPRRGEAPWGGAESMPQGVARHPLLDPCRLGRTLDRLVINRPWQMMTPPPGPERLSRDMTARLRVRRSFHHIDNRHRKIKSVGFSVSEASSRFLQIKNPKSTINNHQSIPGNRWSAPQHSRRPPANPNTTQEHPPHRSSCHFSPLPLHLRPPEDLGRRPARVQLMPRTEVFKPL